MEIEESKFRRAEKKEVLKKMDRFNFNPSNYYLSYFNEGKLYVD